MRHGYDLGMTDDPGRGAPTSGGAPTSAPRRDPLAVTALVTGLLGLVPISWGFALAALTRPPALRRPGRGLAVGGLVASGIWVLVAIAVAAVLIVRTATPGPAAEPLAAGAAAPATGLPSGSPSAGPSAVPSEDASAARRLVPSIVPPRVDTAIRLSRGDCIVELPSSGRIDDIVLTECTRPHLAQVGATFSPSGTGYPGITRLSTIAGSECPVRMRKALRPGAPALIWRMLIPEKSEWDGGDHSIKCLFQAEKGRLLTSSVVT